MSTDDGEVNNETLPRSLKVVVVGDGAVGKTSLCNVFVNREFPTDYLPTVFENYSANMTIDGELQRRTKQQRMTHHGVGSADDKGCDCELTEVNLQLWDTAGQEGYERIRILSYDNTDCFLVCFSIVDAISFGNVKRCWLQELRKNQPNAHILLVGTKADLRGHVASNSDPNQRTEEVPVKKIRRLVRDQKLSGYVETSAIRGGDDVDRVFHEAIRLVLGKSLTNGSIDDNGFANSCQFV